MQSSLLQAGVKAAASIPTSRVRENLNRRVPAVRRREVTVLGNHVGCEG